MSINFNQPGLPGPAGAGETNDGVNVGVGGVGPYKGKAGAFIQFKNINAGSNKVTITDDVANSEIDIDVVEGNLNLANLGGTLPVAKGGTGAANAAAARTNLGVPAVGDAPTAHQASHRSGGSDALTGNVDANARVAVKKAGVLQGTRRGINLIEGAGISLTVTDDAGNEEVDVTVTSTNATAAPATASYLTLGTDGTLTNERVLTALPSIKFTDTGPGGILGVSFQDPNKFAFMFITDFCEAAIGGTAFTSAVTGTGATGTFGSIPNRAGIWSQQTGTTATGRSVITSSVAGIAPQGAGGIITFDSANCLSALSDGTNTFVAIVGFGDTATASTQVDGIFFRYTHTENAGNWSCVTRTGGVETSTNSGVAPTLANTFQVLRIVVNDGTDAQFFINDVLVATNNTNLPGSTGYFGALIGIYKQVGTTTRIIHTDWAIGTVIHAGAGR